MTQEQQQTEQRTFTVADDTLFRRLEAVEHKLAILEIAHANLVSAVLPRLAALEAQFPASELIPPNSKL